MMNTMFRILLFIIGFAIVAEAKLASMYGFFLQDDKDAYFIANHHRNPKSILPSQVFLAELINCNSVLGETGKEERNVGCIRDGVVNQIKSFAAQIVAIRDGVIYKRMSFKGVTGYGSLGIVTNISSRAVSVIIKPKKVKAIKLYKNPSKDSSLILDKISPMDSKMKNNSDIDKVFFIAEEGDEANGFYQAVIIRNESLAFMGYIAKDEITIITPNNKISSHSYLKYLPTSYHEHFFDFHTSLEDISQEGLLSYPKQIEAQFDVVNQKISINPASIPYLPITSDIDDYLSPDDREKLAKRSYGFGERFMTFALQLRLGIGSSDEYINKNNNGHNKDSQAKFSKQIVVPFMDLWVEDEDLKFHTSFPLEHNRLCPSKQWLQQEFVNIDFTIPKDYDLHTFDALPNFLDSCRLKSNSTSTCKISKFSLVQMGGEGVLVNDDEKKKTHKLRYIENKTGNILIPQGAIDKKFLVDCREYDLRSIPDYKYAKSLLDEMKELKRKKVDETESELLKFELLKNGKIVGHRYEGFKSIKESENFAKFLRCDDSMESPDSDTRIMEQWEMAKSIFWSSDFIFLGDSPKEKMLAIHEKINGYAAYLVDENSVMIIDTYKLK